MKKNRRNNSRPAAIATAKDTTKAIETRAGVLKEAEDVKKEAKTSFYLQYMGKEISTEEITKKVHEVWTKEYGKSVEEIKTLNVYLKPEEAAAYYVINEETTGKVNKNKRSVSVCMEMLLLFLYHYIAKKNTSSRLKRRI